MDRRSIRSNLVLLEGGDREMSTTHPSNGARSGSPAVLTTALLHRETQILSTIAVSTT